MSQDQPAAASGTFKIGGELPVHRLGFGAMRITGRGIWGPPADHHEAVRVLRRTIELGINFIDTADSYGPHVSETLIAEALHPYPNGLVIATKGGLTRPGPDVWVPDGHPKYLRAALEGSLKRLKLDTIDLYQLHRVDPKVPLEDSLGTLIDARDEGLIRFIGLSEVDEATLDRARELTPIATVQNRYNLADRQWESMVDACDRDRTGFIPWFPLAVGNLARPADTADERFSSAAHDVQRIAADLNATVSQVALAWLLRRSETMLPIPGTGRVQHLEENTAAATLTLSDDAYARLTALQPA